MTFSPADAITGREGASPTTARGALSEFYRAFNGRDLALMAHNWLSTNEASMDNPLGGIKRGWNEIGRAPSWLWGGNAGRLRVRT